MPQTSAASEGSSPGPEVAKEEGFFLEYIMQATTPAMNGAPATAGPHVAEIVLKGAKMQYPLATMRSFCHDIVETYSHYIYAPWVSPYPEVGQQLFPLSQ